MGDVQHEVLSVLLESLYTRELLSKTTYESANQLVQSTIDFPRFFGYPVCCNKRPQALCMRATERSEALSES